MAEDIKKKAEKEIKYLFEKIDTIDLDSIQTEGVTLRAGNKVLKLQVVSEDPLSIEDEIRAEFKEKVNKQLSVIKKHINDKISEMGLFVSKVKSEFDRKERELKEKMNRARPMPDIMYETHGKQGLSVLKGHGRDELIWLVQGVYSPKTVDFKKLDGKFVRKLITPIIYQITTKGESVIGVSTHKLINLGYFQHYHQQNPDCWGQWKYSRKWDTPDDIIRIGREAEAVLENINSKSIAKQSPSGLPRFETVKRHITEDKKEKMVGITRKDILRTGVTEEVRMEEDMWITNGEDED